MSRERTPPRRARRRLAARRRSTIGGDARSIFAGHSGGKIATTGSMVKTARVTATQTPTTRNVAQTSRAAAAGR